MAVADKRSIGESIHFMQGTIHVAGVITALPTDTLANLKLFPDAPHQGANWERRMNIVQDEKTFLSGTWHYPEKK